MEWTETGPLRATLLVESSISNTKIRQKIRMYADSRRVDFETQVDWGECQHLLKVLFPVDVHTDEATFEIQFGTLGAHEFCQLVVGNLNHQLSRTDGGNDVLA